MIRMNAKLMCKYIEFFTNHLLVSLGNKTNPFNFISLQGKNNFENRVSDYSKANVNHQCPPESVDTKSASGGADPVLARLPSIHLPNYNGGLLSSLTPIHRRKKSLQY